MKTWFLIAAAALASIADEPAPEMWALDSDATFPTTILDDAHPSARFVIHPSWDDNVMPVYGLISGELQAVSTTPTTYNVIVEVRDLANPAVLLSSQGVPIETTASTSTILDAQLCSYTDSCRHDYEVVVNRPAVPGMVVTLDGTVHIHAEGNGTDPMGMQSLVVEAR